MSAFAQLGDTLIDERVKAHLDKLGWKYSTTSTGTFKVVFDMGNDRTQLVLIRSKTNIYEGMEIREIVSNAAKKDDKFAFTQSTLFMLLEKNGTYKLGGWQIDGGEPPYVVQFGIRISANSTQSVLVDAINLAAKMADQMEQQLTEADDF